ncbi:hypothetical protein HBI71_104510 [Parastagonospora nodorum]|nr:hypothetical protein HBI00_049490 [Parastagonospora nodorum]KAH5261020.1 hypothetical protein HBI71_104510 [Parastagonospora nodorum]
MDVMAPAALSSHLIYCATRLRLTEAQVMAASLPSLPAELLLHIIECGPDPRLLKGGYRGLPFHISGIMPDNQRSMLIALRTTCVELNAKLAYFFGSKYLKDIIGSLSEPGLLRLQEISKGPLRVHVQRVTIAVSTLFQQHFYETDSDSTDATQCSWYSKSALEEMDVQYCECNFVESVAQFVADGSCSRLLRPVFSGLFKSKSFHYRTALNRCQLDQKKVCRD